MKQLRFWLCVTVMMGICDHISGQGCSDAGICTSGSLRPQAYADTVPAGSIALNMITGFGDQGTVIITPQLELTSRMFANNSVQLKLPYVFTSGNLGHASGVGDIIITDMHRLKLRHGRALTLNAGVRLAMNQADKAIDGKPLPMPYQTSLGTHDLLLGMSLNTAQGWFYAVGLQAPFFQNNDNGFYTAHPAWAGNADAGQYFNSNLLNRRDDAMARIEKAFIIKRSGLSAGVLGIYHLGHDRYIDPGLNSIAIHGSKGLTINLNGSYTYKVTDQFELSFRAATPVAVRKARPDGLTRSLVLSLMGIYIF